MLTHLSVGCTNLLHRALGTARVIAGANGCAEVHESLVPIVGLVGWQDAFGECEHLGVIDFRRGRIQAEEDAVQHPANVCVNSSNLLVISKAGNCTSCITPNTLEGEQFLN